jgi:AcrR family transcriptional regulator
MTQKMTVRKSNAERSAQMRDRLIATARQLFIDQGFSDTSTPDIVKAANVTRGALYHHFDDKKDLFEAIIRVENAAVSAEIDQASPLKDDVEGMLMAGASAYFDAMQKPGRCRLLLLDGPAVLGYETMYKIDADHSGQSLQEGITAAIQAGKFAANLNAATISTILAAAFDRAALLVTAGTDKQEVMEIFSILIGALNRKD